MHGEYVGGRSGDSPKPKVRRVELSGDKGDTRALVGPRRVQGDPRPRQLEARRVLERRSEGDGVVGLRRLRDAAGEAHGIRTLVYGALGEPVASAQLLSHPALNAIADAHMEKKPFGFGILTVLHLRQGAVLFERHGAYIDDINWDEVLSCGPPDLEDVAHYRCQPLTGSGPAEELETLPYMVDLNVIEKAVLGRLLFRGALARR